MFFPIRRAVVFAASIVLPHAIPLAVGSEIAQSEKADGREQQSLEAAARQYRVQVYETYRLDRAEFERRRTAGDRAQALWHEAGARGENLSELLKWLEQATLASQPEVRQPLPKFPTFGPSGSVEAQSVTRAVVPQRIAPANPPRSDPNKMRLPPVIGNITPDVLRRPPPAPTVRGHQTSPPRQFSPRANLQNTVTAPPAHAASPTHGVPAPNVTETRVGRALLPAPWEVVAPAPSQPTVEIGSVQRRGAEIGRSATPPGVQNPSRIQGTAQAAERAAVAAAPASPVQTAAAIRAGEESERTAREITTVGNPKESPAGATLPSQTPDVVRPQVHGSGEINSTANAPAEPSRVALARPNRGRSAADVSSILRHQSPPAEPAEPAVNQIDTGELLARASGYGFGLRTIDSVLHEQPSLDAAALARLLGELEALVEQRGDLMLYEQLVGAEVRRRLTPALAYPQTTVAVMGSRIAAARERLTQQTEIDGSQREVGLQQLAELSKRLSRLSSK